MRNHLAVVITTAALGVLSNAPNVAAQSAADSAAIRAAALDYVEGWYEGNAERMGRAVHHELVKRIIARDTVSGRAWISNQGWGNLVAGTARGGGKSTPAADRRKEIQILDIYGAVASVRATMSGWIDYMHLAKVDGRWQIVNVLWEFHPPAKR
ncbi:MAG: nuclear transport factor 2 family protein [Gemmatimonadaceae bacterium]